VASTGIKDKGGKIHAIEVRHPTRAQSLKPPPRETSP
jgi:hypothetical protein